MKKIKILIADDHALVRDGLKMVLSTDKRIQVVGEAKDGLEALEMTKKLVPDITLMDFNMPNMNGIEALMEIQNLQLGTRVVLLSMQITPEITLKAYRNGASGYIAKDIRKDRLIEAVHRVNNGEDYFDSKVREEVFRNYSIGIFSKIDPSKNKIGLEMIVILGMELIAGSILGCVGL